MNAIVELLQSLYAAFQVLISGQLNQAFAYVPGRMPQVLATTITFTSTSEELSGSIELPENQNGWVVLAVRMIPTTSDFTVALRRSVGSRALTPSKVYSSMILVDVSGYSNQSLVPPFDAASKETFTFEAKNGSTASNVVRISMLVREK